MRAKIMNDMEKKYLQLIRFVVISNEPQVPKYCRSVVKAVRSILIPRSYFHKKYTAAACQAVKASIYHQL